MCLLAHRKKAVLQQKQDIFDPLWSTSRQHDYRMAAMWATLRQLRLACTGLLAHLDQLNARWARACLPDEQQCNKQMGVGLCMKLLAG